MPRTYVTMRLDPELLAEVDAIAAERNITRTRIFEMALTGFLDAKMFMEADEEDRQRAESIPCPICGAKPGEPCVGETIASSHRVRVTDAALASAK